ncbi:substrate-binding domain-containing protein [Humibacillus xanthopallidus]|uniref:von Willebrand factor type A domain-containing protein n=1 Tax=Humibacillus xanthopallidus TaxID=412689 RepID=A0A543HUV7_9MICO|nr:substrate-binding domain-containing protein [Humibacillus xanthopallidus]TQM62145.1 von Willebrand factor type A domain-containing protein [Humibacillus xanthopallidus]
MTGVGGPDQQGQQAPPPSSTGRRIGPYEQSLIDSRERVEARARERARRQRRTRTLAAVLVAVLVAGAGYAAWRIVGQPDVATSVPESAAQPTSCAEPTTVRLAVAPVVAPVVATAAEALSKHADGPCAAYEIEPAQAYAVAGSLSGSAVPDGWVTDSLGLLDRVEQTSGRKLTATEPFASTGLVVAMPAAAADAVGDDLSWARLLTTSTPVRVPDPNRTTIGRLALGAAASTLDEAKLRAAFYGSARGGIATVALDGVATSAQPVGAVVTEAEVSAWNAAHPEEALTAIAPREGSAAVEYSLIPVATTSATRSLVTALGDYLKSDEARKLLQDSGFRMPSGGDAKAPTPLIGTVSIVATPSPAAIAKATAAWNASAPKAQTLLALDVSGSMLERTKEGTRLAVVQRATARALGAAAPQTRTSLWAYSQHIGTKGDDQKQLVGYDTLGDPAQLTAIEDSLAKLNKMVGGGSGLYDTVAAAYDRAKGTFAPGHTNSVVIVADGPNEDDYGLSLDLLKQRLASAKDPARPVRVVIIGLGTAVDEKAMKDIAATTGGSYLAAPTVDDLEPVLLRALGG